MRRLLATAAVLAVAATAAPAVADGPAISGVVLDVDGRPVKGATVMVIREPEYGFFGLGFLSCLFDSPPWCWYHTQRTKTDARGRYSIELDPEKPIGESGRRLVHVTRPQPTAGPAATVTLSMTYHRAPVELPPLRFWAGGASVGPDTPGTRVVSVMPPGPEYGVPVPATEPDLWNSVWPYDPPQVLLSSGRRLMLTYDFVPHARPADTRTVELGITGASGAVNTYLDGYFVRYLGMPQRVTGGVRPVSRGMPCYVYDARGRTLPLPGCRFTDGRLDIAPSHDYVSARGRRGRAGVLVDLRSVRTVSAFAFRGCDDDEHVVETSTDGRTFTTFERHATGLGDDLIVGNPVEARYVRFTSDWRCDTPVTELSAFAPL